MENAVQSHICQNPLVPHSATIIKIIDETPDVKTFQVKFDDPEIHKSYRPKPGQCGQFSVIGVGEATISITSALPRIIKEDMVEFAIKKVGRLTTVIHELEVGSKVAIRGPYGSNFPYEAMKGKNLIIVGGGIGLAPVRSLIDWVLDEDNRKDYGHVDIIYGARTSKDLVFRYDLEDRWPKSPDTNVIVGLYKEEPGWNGRVGFPQDFLPELKLDPANTMAAVCGAPSAIKRVNVALEKLNFSPEQIISTLELKMKCGIGKCGRCNIGHNYVCIDGPVFSYAQIKAMPQEY